MTSSSHNVRVQLRDGSWLVDWDVVAKIERAKYRAIYRCACEPKPVQREGISSLWMPELSTLDVDFDHVNAKADTEAALRTADLKRRLATSQLSGELLRHELRADQAATESAAAAAAAAAEAVTSKILESAKIEQVMRKLTIPVSVSLKVRREVGKELREHAADDVGQLVAGKGIDKLGDFFAGAQRPESQKDAPRPFKNLVATGSHVFDAVLDQAVGRSPEHTAHRPAAHEKLHAGHAR